MENQSFLPNNMVAAARVAGRVAIVSVLATFTGLLAYWLRPASAVALQQEGFDEPAQKFAGSATQLYIMVSVFISLLCFYFLFRFSLHTRKAAQKKDPAKMETALYSLAGYFKIGSVICVMLVLFFILFLISGVLGLSGM